jgi:predicted component of type VI protein secretion system
MVESSGYKLRILHGSRVGAYKLAQRNYSLGRATGDGGEDAGRILLDDATVSRRHAELTWDSKSKSFSLVHLSSTNSTYIDGVALKLNKPTKLSVGDEFQLGLVMLTLERAVPTSTEAVLELPHQPKDPRPITASKAEAPTQNSIPTPTPVPIAKPNKEKIDGVASQVMSILTNLKEKG